ncbi:MAG: hypothetical protein ACYCVB_11450 [Bacilli bacterium]
MRKYLLGALSASFFLLTGCGNQATYDPIWKVNSVNTGAQWEVNQSHDNIDSDTEFRWTIYTATKSRTPDYTYWTTKTSWKQLSNGQAKKLAGDLWRFVPAEHLYFYTLATPATAWAVAPATMEGVATTLQNSRDNNRLVKDILYGSVRDSPIFIATTPLQLTSVTTNQDEQSITFTWKPLSSS